MEIIVVLVVLGIVLYYFAFRKKPDSFETTNEVPYKVETPPVLTEVVSEPAVAPVQEPVKPKAKKATATKKTGTAKKTTKTKKSKSVE